MKVEHIQETKKDEGVDVWKSVKPLAPLFLVAGIYFKDEKRRKCLDFCLKIYSALVLLSLVVVFFINVVQVAFFIPCTALFLYKIVQVFAIFYAVTMQAVWMKIIQKQEQCCCVLGVALHGLDDEIHQQLRKIVKIWMGLVLLVILFINGRILYYAFSLPFEDGSGDEPEFAFISLIITGGTYMPDKVVYTLTFLTTFYLFSNIALFLAYFILWCYFLYQTFTKFQIAIKNMVGSEREIPFEIIENLRLKYELCLESVLQCDTSFKYYIGYTIFHVTSNTCIYIYMAASSEHGIALPYIINIGFRIIIFITMAGCPALVYNNVSTP